MGLSFEQIVKQSTKPLNPPKESSLTQAPPLSKRERRLLRLFREISDFEQQTILTLLKTMARNAEDQ